MHSPRLAPPVQNPRQTQPQTGSTDRLRQQPGPGKPRRVDLTGLNPHPRIQPVPLTRKVLLILNMHDLSNPHYPRKKSIFTPPLEHQPQKFKAS